MCLYQISAAPTSVVRLFSQELCTENYVLLQESRPGQPWNITACTTLGMGARHCRTGDVGFAKMVRELYQGLV